MSDRARCVIVDRNDWFRKLLRGELEDMDVELVGEARFLREARDIVISREPEAVCVTPELDERGKGVLGLLSAATPGRCPALVLLGQFRAPAGYNALGSCHRLGKADGVRALADALIAAAGERRELLRAMSGKLEPEAAVDTLLGTLGLGGGQTGCAYLRHAVLTAVRDGTYIRAKGLYADAAEFFSTSPSDVERDIRFVVSASWQKAPITSRIMLFGSGADRAPGNTELICTLADLAAGRTCEI